MSSNAPRIQSETTLFEGKFLKFSKLTYVDCKGAVRAWESADRTGGSGRRGNTAAAVIIIAVIEPQNEVLLIRQFRPPAGKMMIEFPAGLIDPGEDAATAAQRELLEETGFEGEVQFILPPSYSSPGMTGESVAIAAVKIDGTRYGDALPQAHPEECESIDVFRVKRSELAGFIAEQQTAGCGIDSKIYTFLAMQQL
ncbi:MAG: NUDIX hydrolase [Lentisphaeria bacterium]|nr:NUDIX hydrolase [Lentisphaeria bacterium]